jgi:ribosomal protein L32
MLPDDLPVDRGKLLTWETECWRCGEETPVVWPRDDHLDTPIGGVLAEYETPVERVYSNTLDERVWGNVCQQCNSYQGNHFIKQEAIEIDPPLVECPNCGNEHEWRPDQGMGGAFGQGWVSCPEYGEVPVGDPREE